MELSNSSWPTTRCTIAVIRAVVPKIREEESINLGKREQKRRRESGTWKSDPEIVQCEIARFALCFFGALLDGGAEDGVVQDQQVVVQLGVRQGPLQLHVRAAG